MDTLPIILIIVYCLFNQICAVDDEHDLPPLLEGDSDSSEFIAHQHSNAPSPSPTQFPTFSPSKSPTIKPTRDPTTKPTKHPSHHPTHSPTATPTESWDNRQSSKQHQPKSKSKKKSHHSSDEQLLRSIQTQQTQDKSGTSTAIKIYHLANTSNTDYFTKFQNDMITQHRDDFLLFGTFEYIPPSLNPKLQELPDGSRKRIYAYSGLFQIIGNKLHEYSDIMQTHLIHLGDNNKFDARLLNQQLLVWYKNIIELYKQLNLKEIFEKVMGKMEDDETMKVNGRTEIQKFMFENTRNAFSSARFTLFLSTAMEQDALYFLSAFYGYSCSVIWTTFFEEVVLMIRNSRIVPSSEVDKYLNYTKVYFTAVSTVITEWNTCVIDKKPLNSSLRIREVFNNMLTELTPYALIEFIYEWKYGPTSDQHKHRNVYIVIKNVNVELLKELISFLNGSTNKYMKTEEYVITLRVQKKKHVFDTVLLNSASNATHSSTQHSGCGDKDASTAKPKRKPRKK